MKLFLAFWKRRFGVETPDRDRIEAEYAAHDRTIAELRTVTRKVRRWRIRLATTGRSGNVVRDLAAGSYRSPRQGEAHHDG